ncbi:bifunctional adenosylcobinamide kinase/adenosylcobinamide-phosphate guanylyltransferase [Rhizobium sp.]|uniref:bifunctional adenosylcobinamide kinase/adenosylcobinamide-phosphate guanylyltransferase n=1 Tax=Rhizobium sp. TaxID=391 RepID=UPI0028A6E5A3
MILSGKTALVLGGARSGKSAFSERVAEATGLERHYIATGRAYDDEMRERISRHQEDRGPSWVTHEEPVELSHTLGAIDRPGRVVLVDCLTLWVTNLMMEGEDIPMRCAELAAQLSSLDSRIIFVSNEVGLGIVPENRMAREFRDHAGRLHQQIAASVDEVFFVAAGLPLRMKG